MTDPKPAWRRDLPHNTLPDPPPGAELESKAVLKACITARAALAELEPASALIPNLTMLINTIPLLEAKDSSEIENIVTTTDLLFRHAQADPLGSAQADLATKEALRYRSALHSGHLSMQDRPLCTRTAVDICRTLKGVDKGVAQRQAASRCLKDLVTLGVLQEMPLGKEKLFIHPKLMQLISRDSNSFARYA